MNDEIKEILEWLDYGVNSLSISKPPFKVPYKDIEKILDYITNLQEENEKLINNQRYYKKGVFSLEYDKETLSDMIDDYKSRIDKAISFINDNAVYKKITINQQVYYNEYIVNQALNILRGDKE